jgi:hypothetical protein
MGGGGGKGGETQQQIDPGLTAAARDALDFAAAGAAIPYSPNRGVQFAAFTPQQEAAMEGADEAATAFGLPSGGGLVERLRNKETSASGIEGYSTGADFDEMKNKSMAPGLQAALAKLFADPETGAFKGPAGPLFRKKYGKMPLTAGGGGK